MLVDRGLRVCLVDKARFPSETPSTHGIQPNGVRVLERMGVAADLAAMTDPITRARLAFGDTRLVTGDVREIVGAPMLNLRRVTLDAFLVDHARERGVDVREETPVTDLVRVDGRVAGVVTPAGEIRAPLVVGADGARSTVARLAGAREYLRTDFGRSFTWAYFAGHAAPAHTVWLGKIDDIAYLASPTDEDLVMVAVVPSRTARSATATSTRGSPVVSPAGPTSPRCSTAPTGWAASV
jgi:2-polyprenyl-6-methoxyphenol hydroxylase-like FAD-dependent oxidoreductase